MNKSKKYFGKYRGIVTQPVDTGVKGRITATVTIGGTPVPVVAEACTPFAGLGSGFYAIPPVGAGVWIEFEEGDLNKPIWTGSWWSEGELPLSMATVAPLQALPVIIQSLGRNHIVIGSTPADGIRIETEGGPAGPSMLINSVGIIISDGKGGMISVTGGVVTINQGALVIK
jgi:Type VI secretion system/phage-baseplate injector OB domain